MSNKLSIVDRSKSSRSKHLRAPIKSLTSQPEFTGRTPLMFLAAHLIIGISFQFINFDKFQWGLDIFVPIDAVFPAFRTIFSHSTNPFGCKLLLLLWWTILLPWGFAMSLRFLSGFKQMVPLAVSPPKRLSILLFGILSTSIVFYGNSFKEYSLVMPSDISRLNVQYLILRHGPLSVSIYLFCCSVVAIMGAGLAFIMTKLFCVKH